VAFAAHRWSGTTRDCGPRLWLTRSGQWGVGRRMCIRPEGGERESRTGGSALDAILQGEALYKSYLRRETHLSVLNGISLVVGRGEILGIIGPSGSGKTTLMNILSTLDRPSSGRVRFLGKALDEFGDPELAMLRRRKFGFVFQFFNLLPSLTALENVALPGLLDGRSLFRAEERGCELLEAVGLGARSAHYPHQLSGGEMQRVAVARALAMEPEIIFADEPTGNLDSENGNAVLALLVGQTRLRGGTLLIVTHDARVAEVADRVVEMRDGRIAAAPAPALSS
jgi:putative ABC transport system ATP-binding protein